MVHQPSPEFSGRLYASLLKLYPREFLEEFGAPMQQLFADQCRCAAREGGRRGLFFLWMRTLSDLAGSLLREHLASPRASLGLFEAVPNQPLPWKGVALVLIPGAVFLVGQIGQLAGEDWFFLLVRRAAYYLFIPVLLIWIVRRKFPIWGLIPLGMLYRTLWELGQRLDWFLGATTARLFESRLAWPSPAHQLIPALMNILSVIRVLMKAHGPELDVLAALTLLACAAVMIAMLARRRSFPRAAVIWTVVFTAFLLVEMAAGPIQYYSDNGWSPARLMDGSSVSSLWQESSYSVYSAFSSYAGFFLLILIGAFLARRHGRLAALLPLGYLIPTVVLGRYEYDPAFPYQLLLVGLTVFIYRLIVAVIAPVWIVRSATDGSRKRAAAAGLLAAIGILFAAHLGNAIFWISITASKWDLWNMYFSLSPELITLVGVVLAVALYRKSESDPAPISTVQMSVAPDPG